MSFRSPAAARLRCGPAGGVYAYTGDFNLDGKVSVKDTAICSANYGIGAGTRDCALGDTNWEGSVTVKNTSRFSAAFHNGTVLGSINDPVIL